MESKRKMPFRDGSVTAHMQDPDLLRIRKTPEIKTEH